MPATGWHGSNQRAEKHDIFEKIQLGEHLATNYVNWHQVCNMISYKRDVLERQSLSEVKMGRGSPICERVRKKIVEYFKNNVPQRQIAKALQISSSTVHNIIKRFRETGEISVRKTQGGMGTYGMGSLHVLEGTMNAERYIKNLFLSIILTVKCHTIV